ncbi:MAG: NYN domain-containing protein [Candidatus Gracilibacteria bacterium]|jgi:hypothetical protein
MVNNQTTQSVAVGRVLLLIDWDNFIHSLIDRFGNSETRIEERLQKLIEWIKGELGELMDGGFVFAPEHLIYHYQEICRRNGLKLMVCPKIPKTENMEKDQDTVDENIIEFAEMMIGHRNLETVCLVSGDGDYVPLLEKMGREGIKRAIAPPAINSLSGELIELIDENPKTGKKMVLMLDRIL